MKLITSTSDLADYLYTIPKIWRDTPLEVAFEVWVRRHLAKGFTVRARFNIKNERFIVTTLINGRKEKWSTGWISNRTIFPKTHKLNQKELRGYLRGM